MFKFFCPVVAMILLIVFSSCKTYVISGKSFRQKFAVADTADRITRVDSLIVYGRKEKKDTISLDSSWKIEVQWMQGKIFSQNKRYLFDVSALSYYDSCVYFRSTINGNQVHGKYQDSIPWEDIGSLTLVKIPGTDTKCWLKAAPLVLADLYGGNSFRGGVEFKVYRNIALSAIVGGFIPNGLSSGTNVHGVIIQPELKIYLNHSGRTVGDYISLEYIYKNNRFNMTDSIYGIPDYETTYTMHKTAQAVLLKWGRQYVHGSHFVFDFNFGGGVRQINASADLSEAEQNHIMSGEGHGGVIYGVLRYTGLYYSPQITVGFKLGWKIF
jgi:hypothetical protein